MGCDRSKERRLPLATPKIRSQPHRFQRDEFVMHELHLLSEKSSVARVIMFALSLPGVTQECIYSNPAVTVEPTKHDLVLLRYMHS